MPDGFKIADAYVDVHADISRRELERTASRAGQSAGVNLSDGIGRGVSGLGANLASNPYILGAGAVIVATVAPVIAAGISGAIIAGAGVGVIGLGALLLKDIPQLATAGKNLKAQFTGIFKDAAKVMQGPFLDAIGIFSTTLTALAPQIKAMFSAIAPAIVPLAQGIADLATNAMPGFISMLQVAGPMLAQLAPALGILGGALSMFFQSIAAGGPDATLFLTDLIKFTAGLIVGLGALIGWLTKAYSSIRGFLLLVGTMSGMVIGAVASLVSGVTSLFSGLPGKISSAISSIPGRVSSVISSARSQASSLASSLVSGVASLLASLPGRARSALASFASSVTGALRGAVSGATGIGRDIIRGVISGIGSMVGAAVAAARSAAGSIVSGMKGALGIHSPSKVMRDEVGRWMLPGLTQGVERTLPQARGVVADATRSLVPTTQAVGATASATPTTTYHFAQGAITLDASSVRSMQDVIDLITGIQRSARVYGARV